MISIIIKILISLIFVVGIILLSGTKYVYLTGLLPLFPTFALISHITVSTSNAAELRNVILFGFWAIIPYMIYLGSMYYFASRVNIYRSSIFSLGLWVVVALILIFAWEKVIV